MRRFLSNTLRHGLLSAMAIGAMPGVVSATDLAKDTSLPLAPADVDFYSSSLRMKEQWQRFWNSELVMELRNTEVVRQIVQRVEDEWEAGEGPVAQAQAMINTPLVQDILALGKEMMSEEMFVLGSGEFSEMYLKVAQMQQEIMSIIQTDGDEVQEAFTEWIDSLTKEECDDIPIPTFVVGFRIQDQERALSLLDQLQGIVALGLGSVPQLAPVADAFQRVEDARGTRLVLSLSSELVPWDEIPDQGDEQQAMIDKVREILEDRELTISIGQLDQYVILGISEGADAIKQLGQGETLLNSPHLKPLKTKANEDLTSIYYVSDAFSQAQFQVNLQNRLSMQLVQLESTFENQFGDDLPEFMENFPDDMRWLGNRVSELLPEFRGSMGFAFSTSQGQEGYSYNRTQSVILDGSKKLDVLKHCGKNPLAFAAARQKYPMDYFQLAREVGQKVHGYLEAVSEGDWIDGDEQEHLQLFLEKGWPLLERLADLVEHHFLPATKDGQHAWSLTFGNLKSEQWLKEMPRSDEALPLPEVAMIVGVSDKQLLVDGFINLFAWGDSLVEVIRELEPENVPAAYSIPRPEKKASSYGDKYVYSIPDDCPVPKEMAPQALINDHYLIASYSEAQAAQIAASNSLTVDAKVIDSGEHLAAALYVDFGGIVKAATPWIRYAIISQAGDMDAMILPAQDNFPGVNGKAAMEIWGAFSHLGKLTSSTQLASASDQGEGTVTHWTYTR